MRNGLGATEGVTSESRTLGVLRWGEEEEEGEDQEKEVGARV